MARDYNTRHLELITGLYAEKMNDSMEYLQNYAQDNVKVAQAMEDKTPAQILACMEENLDSRVFCGIGLIGEKGKSTEVNMQPQISARRGWTNRLWRQRSFLLRSLPVQ